MPTLEHSREKLLKSLTLTTQPLHHIWWTSERKENSMSRCRTSWRNIGSIARPRLEVCSSFLLCNKSGPFIKRIATSEEEWIFCDDPRRSGSHDEAPNHFPKPASPQKKLFGGQQTVWPATDSWLRVKPSQAEKHCQVPGSDQQKRCSPAPWQRTTTRFIGNKKMSEWVRGWNSRPRSSDLSPTSGHFFKHLGFSWARNAAESKSRKAFEGFVASRTWVSLF